MTLFPIFFPAPLPYAIPLPLSAVSSSSSVNSIDIELTINLTFLLPSAKTFSSSSHLFISPFDQDFEKLQHHLHSFPLAWAAVAHLLSPVLLDFCCYYCAPTSSWRAWPVSLVLLLHLWLAELPSLCSWGCWSCSAAVFFSSSKRSSCQLHFLPPGVEAPPPFHVVSSLHFGEWLLLVSVG